MLVFIVVNIVEEFGLSMFVLMLLFSGSVLVSGVVNLPVLFVCFSILFSLLSLVAICQFSVSSSSDDMSEELEGEKERILRSISACVDFVFVGAGW